MLGMGKPSMSILVPSSGLSILTKFHVLYALHKKTGPCHKFQNVKWVGFKTALLKQKGEVWEALKSSDLVLGGIPLSGDFMCVYLFNVLFETY